MLESDYTMVKVILDELLRVRCIPRKQYKALCEQIGLGYIFEITYPKNKKIYCAQDNGIYCSDCNKSYIPNNYSNHLKSKGRFINVMKKQSNNDMTHCDNHNLTCSMNEVSLESNDSIKQTFQTFNIL